MKKPPLLLLALTACVSSERRAAAPESPPYTFSHAIHTGTSCTACHARIVQAAQSGPWVHVDLPRQGDAACAECHTSMLAPPPRRAVEQAIRFSHAGHASPVRADCTTCHTSLSDPGDSGPKRPAMARCTHCHRHAQDYATARCAPCHVDLKRYPLEPVADFKHQGDFLRLHGELARHGAATCAACHDQTSCAECHAAATRPVRPELAWPEKVGASFIHRGDFVSRHALDAKANPASCRSCHGSGYCQSCHAQQGVLPGAASRNPHPSGWSSGTAHGAAARADILACASCHDQGAKTVCVTCHKNINPHPPSWGRRHNKTTDVASNSMCRTCH